MQVTENNELFTQLSAEESSFVSGGNLLNFAIFSFFAISPASFGGTDYTVEEFILGIAILSQTESTSNNEILDNSNLFNLSIFKS